MARTEINNVLSKIIDDGHNTFHEHLSQFPNGFVREMLTEFDADLKVLHAMEGVHEVKFLVGPRKLKIVSSSQGHVELMEALRSLAARMPEASQDEEEACSVCLTPPEGKERVRLEVCGHLYCSPCLAMQVMSAPWPLLCSFEGCSSPWVAEDLRRFESDQEVMKRIVRGSLEDNLLQPTSNLHACPSPNCEGVFRKLSPEEKGSNQDPFFCTFCGANICRGCCSVFHQGMTCEFYQISRTDDDHSLKVWFAEKPEDRKRCGQCQAPIEKAGGCLHVHCARCGAHMCWWCMVVFPTGGQVYHHACSARR